MNEASGKRVNLYLSRLKRKIHTSYKLRDLRWRCDGAISRWANSASFSEYWSAFCRSYCVNYTDRISSVLRIEKKKIDVGINMKTNISTQNGDVYFTFFQSIYKTFDLFHFRIVISTLTFAIVDNPLWHTLNSSNGIVKKYYWYYLIYLNENPNAFQLNESNCEFISQNKCKWNPFKMDACTILDWNGGVLSTLKAVLKFWTAHNTHLLSVFEYFALT